jgi:hypothetical protein
MAGEPRKKISSTYRRKIYDQDDEERERERDLYELYESLSW